MSTTYEKLLVSALAPLVAIANAYDADDLDDSARKYYYSGDVKTRNDNYTPEEAELYYARGGRILLTLAHALYAREVVNQLQSCQPLVVPETLTAVDSSPEKVSPPSNGLWTRCLVALPKKNGFYDCTLEGVWQVMAVAFNPQQGWGLKDWPQGSSVLAWKEYTPPYQPEVEEAEEEGDE